ncbi:FAD/FMN-containing dehydrogenase [Apiospora saccharicola]
MDRTGTAQAAGDKEIWASLNSILDGRLRQLAPFAKPCFSNFDGQPTPLDEAACATVRNNYTTNTFRDEQPAGFMNPQSETCLSDPADQCILDSTTKPAGMPSPNATCSRGSVPAHYIAVQSASDVVTAMSFARAHRDSDDGGVYLVVKNSGHDYMTRNSGGGSALMLWMHRLKGMTFHESFVPDGCNSGDSTEDTAASKGMRAMTVAAGESTGDAFAFAAAHDSLVLGGYSPTIALSGGWILGAGHGPMAPVYGLGVDRVVQMRVVTPDGVERVASACNEHADLFRALRGGGVGGAFGVVLEATHKLEVGPLPIAVASLKLPDNATEETVWEWIELQARNSLRWGREGWGGHVAGLYLTHFNPLPAIANISDGSAAAASESMREASEFVLAHGGTIIVEVLPDFLSAWNKFVAPGAAKTAGNSRFISSRLVPRDMFADEAGIQKIMAFLKSLPRERWDPRNLYVPVATPFVAANTTAGASGASAVQPAWYTALWALSTAFTLPWDATYEKRLDSFTWFTDVTRQHEVLTGGKGGAYVNEANPFTQDWEEAWWGRDNYEQLLKTKRKYDPNGLMNCWKCVGFDEADLRSDRFRCQGRLQLAIDEMLAQSDAGLSA